MKKNGLDATTCRVVLSLLISVILLLPVVARAGNLDPSDPPSSGTMHSLEDIYDKQLEIEEQLKFQAFMLRAVFLQANNRFVEMEQGSVKDMKTGLVWLKDASCDALAGTDGGKADWPTARSAADVLESGICGLADGSVAGDWRLPTKQELQEMGIDLETDEWTVPDAPFEGVYIDVYWTLTLDNDPSANEVFAVGMADGAARSYHHRDLYYVWPVREDN